MTEPDKHKLGFWNRFFRGPGVILLIPWGIMVVLFLLVYALCMGLIIRIVCCLQGRYVVFVHSNSPVWQDYIVANMLPRLPPDAIILNWSERSKWNWFSFPVRVFKLYGGDANFNPIGLVGTSRQGMKSFRFWQPFMEFKHGNEEPVRALEERFFSCIDQTQRR